MIYSNNNSSGHTRPLFRLFSVYSNKRTNSKFFIKMSIQYPVLGSNPRPLEHESPPITTRPGTRAPVRVQPFVILSQFTSSQFCTSFILFIFLFFKIISFIFGLFKQPIQFLQQINMKKCHVHPIYGAMIRTHDLRNVSLFP